MDYLALRSTPAPRRIPLPNSLPPAGKRQSYRSPTHWHRARMENQGLLMLADARRPSLLQALARILETTFHQRLSRGWIQDWMALCMSFPGAISIWFPWMRVSRGHRVQLANGRNRPILVLRLRPPSTQTRPWRFSYCLHMELAFSSATSRRSANNLYSSPTSNSGAVISLMRRVS
jgi:hypothetical protein